MSIIYAPAPTYFLLNRSFASSNWRVSQAIAHCAARPTPHCSAYLPVQGSAFRRRSGSDTTTFTTDGLVIRASKFRKSRFENPLGIRLPPPRFEDT